MSNLSDEKWLVDNEDPFLAALRRGLPSGLVDRIHPDPKWSGAYRVDDTPILLTPQIEDDRIYCDAFVPRSSHLPDWFEILDQIPNQIPPDDHWRPGKDSYLNRGDLTWDGGWTGVDPVYRGRTAPPMVFAVPADGPPRSED